MQLVARIRRYDRPLQDLRPIRNPISWGLTAVFDGLDRLERLTTGLFYGRNRSQWEVIFADGTGPYLSQVALRSAWLAVASQWLLTPLFQDHDVALHLMDRNSYGEHCA